VSTGSETPNIGRIADQKLVLSDDVVLIDPAGSVTPSYVNCTPLGLVRSSPVLSTTCACIVF
jgi:hypothetical protein